MTSRCTMRSKGGGEQPSNYHYQSDSVFGIRILRAKHANVQTDVIQRAGIRELIIDGNTWWPS